MKRKYKAARANNKRSKRRMDHLKAVIVDDDRQSRRLLSGFLSEYPQIDVVGEAEDIHKAVSIIKKAKPDAVFLDIHLKKENGFDLLEKMPLDKKVVFITAYDEYALRAFEVNALDYIMKPFEADRIALTVARLIDNHKKTDGQSNGNGSSNGNSVRSSKNNSDGKTSSSNGNGKNAQEIKAQNKNNDVKAGDAALKQEEYDDDITVKKNGNGNSKSLDYDDYLFLTVEGVSKFVKLNTVECISAEKDYTYVFTNDGKKSLVLKSMIEWEERLPEKYFARIHRSNIVNLEYVEKIEKWFNYSYHVFLRGIKDPMTMSRRYAVKLKEKFK